MKNGILLCLLVTCILWGCAKIEEPEFRDLRDFHIDRPSLSGIGIRFQMVYFNPNNFSVAVKETAAKVYVEDVYLGEFTQDSLLDVKKNAEFVIPLSGEIALSTLVNSDLKKLLKSQVFIRAEGKARIGKAGIFITKDIRYQGRHRLDATLFP